MKPTKKRDFVTIIACIALVLICGGAFYFKLSILEFIPLIISIAIMFLQANVNRYAFLFGAVNSVLYAIAYLNMTLYVSALYALLISCPLQVITFLKWQKHTQNKTTALKSMSSKNRLLLFTAMAAGWLLLYLLFAVFGSKYLLFDNTVAVIGIVASILCAMRYTEYALLQVLSGAISTLLYAFMLLDDPRKAVWLVYSVYAAVCSMIAFVKTTRRTSENVSKK